MEIETTQSTLTEFSEDAFRLQLIKAQYQLRESVQVGRPRGLLVLVNGIETAGKGDAVSNLREWLDPRLLKVSYLPTEKPTKDMPIWQRYAKPLPRHGEITVMFGNWYADLIFGYVKGKLSKKALHEHLRHIQEFEQDLAANDTHIVKCWFDISNKTLEKRFEKVKAVDKLYQIDWDNAKQVEKVRELQAMLTSSDLIKHESINSKSVNSNSINSEQHNGQQSKLDWHIINGEEVEAACIRFAQLVLDGLNAPVYARKKAQRPYPHAPIPEQLLQPSEVKLAKADYKLQLKAAQKTFASLVRKNKKHNVVLAFEGMDAAGKGGAIRRIVSPLDPREYHIHNIGAPEPEELQHPYLWRFWHRLPNHGGLTIFDRTWYGRVLVERVEALASQDAWQEAYAEINRFEQQLVDKNTLILKFWLAIDMDTQLQRFKERENTPHKRFKITPDDWRNRDRWEDYVLAAADMLQQTSTEAAPWHIIATNDKYTARLAVLNHCITALKAL